MGVVKSRTAAISVPAGVVTRVREVGHSVFQRMSEGTEIVSLIGKEGQVFPLLTQESRLESESLSHP